MQLSFTLSKVVYILLFRYEQACIKLYFAISQDLGSQVSKLSPGMQQILQDLKVSVSPTYLTASMVENNSLLNFISNQVVTSLLKERSKFEKDTSELVKQEIKNIYNYSNNCRTTNNNGNAYTINSSEVTKAKRTGSVITLGQTSRGTKTESMTHHQSDNLNIALLSTNRGNSVIGSLNSSMINVEDRSTNNISNSQIRKHTLCQVFGKKLPPPRNTVADINYKPEPLKDFDINILHKLAFGSEKSKERHMSKVKENVRSQSILSLINDSLVENVKKKISLKPLTNTDKVLKSKHKLRLSALPNIVPEFFKVSNKEMSESQLSFYINTELQEYRSNKKKFYLKDNEINYDKDYHRMNAKLFTVDTEKSEHSDSPYLKTDLKQNAAINKKVKELKEKIKFTSRDIKNINLYKKKFNYKSCDFNHNLVLYSPEPDSNELEPGGLPKSMKYITDFENRLANMLTSNAEKKELLHQLNCFAAVSTTESTALNLKKQLFKSCIKKGGKNQPSIFMKKKDRFAEVIKNIKSLEKNRTASMETMVYTKQSNKKVFLKSKSIASNK